MRFPDDFLLGTATAAHQVEGGLENDWMRMEREEPDRIKDLDSAAVAIDHHRRFREDLRQLAADHHSAYRFSIEWARVEPQCGVFDRAAVRHYRRVVRTCRELGLEPVVTLQHFTLPVWLADRGGVIAPDAPNLFARYAAVCAEAMGADVEWWITINEPNVLAVMGYSMGLFPPHETSPLRAMQASAGLLRMHAAGAVALHRVASSHGWRARVSVAHHERRQRPLDSRLSSRLVAPVPDFIFNRWFLRSAQTGRLLPPVGRGERVPGLTGSLDYLGLNYYCEDAVVFDPSAGQSLFALTVPRPGVPRTAFDWEIDPEGLKRALLELWDAFRLPIVITENGVSDDHDELRPQYILDHLGAVQEAMRAGVDVRGYLHWTAWDNFEWLEGYSQRFGLYEVDRETLERRPKPSAALFAEICRTKELPESA